MLSTTPYAQSTEVEQAERSGSVEGLSGVEAAEVRWVRPEPMSTAQELANKRIALQWYREFWGGYRYDQWARYLATDFVNHRLGEPNGGAQFSAYLKEKRPATTGLSSQREAIEWFAIADGDLVFIAHLPAGIDYRRLPADVDASASLSADVVRIDRGRIVELWSVVAGPAPTAADAAAQPDVSGVDLAAGLTRPRRYGKSTVLYDSGTPNAKLEEEEKRWYSQRSIDVMSNQNYDHWPQYLSADFRNHDIHEPAVGAQAFMDWLIERSQRSGANGPVKGAGNPRLMVLAEGDLVASIGASEANKRFDPHAPFNSLSANICRYADGRMVEWWFLGGGTVTGR